MNVIWRRMRKVARATSFMWRLSRSVGLLFRARGLSHSPPEPEGVQLYLRPPHLRTAVLGNGGKVART